jgi:hypothetical protein
MSRCCVGLRFFLNIVTKRQKYITFACGISTAAFLVSPCLWLSCSLFILIYHSCSCKRIGFGSASDTSRCIYMRLVFFLVRVFLSEQLSVSLVVVDAKLNLFGYLTLVYSNTNSLCKQFRKSLKFSFRLNHSFVSNASFYKYMRKLRTNPKKENKPLTMFKA